VKEKGVLQPLTAEVAKLKRQLRIPKVEKFEARFHNHPAFMKRIFPAEVVGVLEPVLGARGNQWMRNMAQVSGASRMMVAALDLSAPWIQGLAHIIENGGECLNLMVQISNPQTTHAKIDREYDRLVEKYALHKKKDVAYTIFPQSLYEKLAKKNRPKLYKLYNRMYPRIKTRWGTYFKRMIDWTFAQNAKKINQLEIIVSRLKNRKRLYRYAYTIQICSPQRNFAQPVGAPCLNYITLQIDSDNHRINMLAVYRNHDYMQRAYGNYIGLSNLQRFICEQSKFKVGMLTILSSHAFAKSPPSRRELQKFIGRSLESLSPSI